MLNEFLLTWINFKCVLINEIILFNPYQERSFNSFPIIKVNSLHLWGKLPFFHFLYSWRETVIFFNFLQLKKKFWSKSKKLSSSMISTLTKLKIPSFLLQFSSSKFSSHNFFSIFFITSFSIHSSHKSSFINIKDIIPFYNREFQFFW